MSEYPVSETRRPSTQDAAPGLLTTAGSVLCAFFGVQSSRARVRDFTRGSPGMFVGVALALTALLVLVLYGVVQVLLRQAGVA